MDSSSSSDDDDADHHGHAKGHAAHDDEHPQPEKGDSSSGWHVFSGLSHVPDSSAEAGGVTAQRPPQPQIQAGSAAAARAVAQKVPGPVGEGVEPPAFGRGGSRTRLAGLGAGPPLDMPDAAARCVALGARTYRLPCPARSPSTPWQCLHPPTRVARRVSRPCPRGSLPHAPPPATQTRATSPGHGLLIAPLPA